MSQNPQPYLALVDPSRTSLSYAPSRPRLLAEWVDQLPKVNHTETSHRLYKAIREINQLKCSPADRLELLDILAPEIEHAADGLFRRYLERPFALDEMERKVLSLTHGMAIELGAGYKEVAQATAGGWGLGRKDMAARALHHCIWSILPNLYRMFSLYLPAPKGFWRELHDLYQLGLQLDSGTRPFDWNGHSRTLNQAYQAALLFSIAQPFQLQRHELDPLFQACVAWASGAQLEKAGQGGIYVVDLTRDQGPSQLSHDTTLHGNLISLYTGDLVTQLQTPQSLPAVPNMTERLRDHLGMAWDRAQPRAFQRKPTQGAVTVTLGLSAVHSQLCGGHSFSHFLAAYADYLPPDGGRDSRFQARDTLATRQSQDAWDQSHDAARDLAPEAAADTADTTAETPAEVVEYPATAVNMSPRGFCLHWPDPVPEHLIMGEVISVKAENASHRTIGLLRWLRQYRGSGVRGGVELLSPQAEACAVRVVNTSGPNSDFLRAILLPEINAVAQPESVVMPRLQVRAGQKILLYRNGRQQAYRLLHKINETSAAGQFSIAPAGPTEADRPKAQKDLDLQNDPLWRPV